MHHKISIKYWLVTVLVIVLSYSLLAGSPDVGLEEQLGKQINSDAIFLDSDSSKIKLSDLMDKPTIIIFAYYNCPTLCSPLLADVAAQINRLDMIPGVDYNIVTISMDEIETPALAKAKKKFYIEGLKNKFPETGWRFLTGDIENIRKVSNSAGFYFKKDGEKFSHPSALIFVSPLGKITRYLYGTIFLPFDIKMAVIEASEGKVTPAITKVLKFCFNYDNDGKRYILNVTRIAGTLTIIFAVIFVLYLVKKPKKNKNEI